MIAPFYTPSQVGVPVWMFDIVISQLIRDGQSCTTQSLMKIIDEKAEHYKKYYPDEIKAISEVSEETKEAIIQIAILLFGKCDCNKNNLRDFYSKEIWRYVYAAKHIESLVQMFQSNNQPIIFGE